MKSLKQILGNYVPPNLTKLGGEETERELNDNDVEELRNELTGLINRQTKRATIYFSVFIVLILISAIAAILAYIINNDPEIASETSKTVGMIANIFTITGVAPLTIYSVVRGWVKERDNAKTLLKLLDSLNRKNFQSVLIVFATMLKK